MPYRELLIVGVWSNHIDGESFYEGLRAKILVGKISPSLAHISDRFARSPISKFVKRLVGSYSRRLCWCFCLPSSCHRHSHQIDSPGLLFFLRRGLEKMENLHVI